MKKLNKAEELLASLDPSRLVIIQPHDFPDHDAVAAAFGLFRLLCQCSFRCIIRHCGAIPSMSLQALIERLAIPVLEYKEEDQDPNAQIVVVDSNPNNGNVGKIKGTIIAVIDHHQFFVESKYPFTDIRIDVGACSSIIASYWIDLDKTPDVQVASALIAGIQTDTDFLTRSVSQSDMDAFYNLYSIAGSEITAKIIKTSLSVEDIPVISQALQKGVVYAGCYFVLLNIACSQEVLAIVADFLIRLREIRMVVIVETGNLFYRVSMRSKDPALSAAKALGSALLGIGTGGGHGNMAGGVIRKKDFPGEQELWKRFVKAAWEGSSLREEMKQPSL